MVRWILLVCVIFSLGCKAVPKKTDYTAEFRGAMAAAASKPTVAAGSDAEREAVRRVKQFLSDINERSVRETTLEVYAADAYLNDTLVVRRGAENIRDYFLSTVEASESVKATIEDVTRAADGGYYFRWTMDVRMKKVAKGKTIRTPGVTLIRFDDQGRVLIHHDFWDSASGLWDHVPVLGRGIRTIKARL